MQLAPILYVIGNMCEQSLSEFAAEQPAVYFLPLEPILETDIFVWDDRQYLKKW